MATLSNIPSQSTTMVLAARKSFSFTVQFVDGENRPLGLAGATVTFTIGQQTYSDTPILTQLADTVLDSTSTAKFNLQASQLDIQPGVYPYEIVVTTSGYSAIAISGELEIEESYEVLALGQSYDIAPSSFRLLAKQRDNRIIVTSDSLILQGPEGPAGPAGVNGNPFKEVTITYNVDDRIESLTIDGETTSYLYNPDGTIAYDERNGVTRNYIYTDGLLTSIEPQTGP